MSIVDNQVDLDAAKAKLAGLPEETLRDDLAYWSTVDLDHLYDLQTIGERYTAVQELHTEARRWTSLYATEIRARRDAKRSGADG